MKPAAAPRRILDILVVTLVLLATATLVRQNLDLKRTLRAVSVGAQHPSAVPSRQLLPGDTLLKFTFQAADGHLIDGLQMGRGRDETIVHFLDLRCDKCLQELPHWRDFAEVHGLANVVFVVVGGADDLTEIPSVDIPKSQILTLRQTDATVMPPYVPMTVTLDSCGIVRSVAKSVADVAKVLPRSGGMGEKGAQ